MRTGVSYMGHHNPKHLKTDLEDIKSLGCDDVLFAIQENDLVYMNGKVEFGPRIAKDCGLNPIAVFWGALNLFGGGRSSQFLLNNPDCHQVMEDGSYHESGCYNHPKARDYIKQFIDRAARCGFTGYFVDEPTITECYCDHCYEAYKKKYSGQLKSAMETQKELFRKECISDYVLDISSYAKKNHPEMEISCCLMPMDKQAWQETAKIDSLDSLGTDIYIANDERIDPQEMRPLVRELAQICEKHGKKHHQWLQAWGVKKGNEKRVQKMAEVLIDENPDALYVWAYLAQVGTSESCEDPEAVWKAVSEMLRKTKG